MKAISLHQPWASLIAEGHKTIETRTWAPPLPLVGQRIAIHAAKRKPKPSEWNREIKLFVDARPAEVEQGKLFATGPRLPLGAVIATAVLDGVAKVADIDERHQPALVHCLGVYPWEPRAVTEDPFGDFGVGRFLWFLKDVLPLPEPIPATGRQGIWDWNELRVRKSDGNSSHLRSQGTDLRQSG